ncbi:hypothetical protein C8R11_101183 [Nitrosomonas aestuarii]|nr:hypothetical protein C8R11_101183 [Nitrosomonas aestuarii]
MKKRLTKAYCTTNPEYLDNLLSCLAGTTEDSLIQNGAAPGLDYTILDLYKLASPYAQVIFADESQCIGFTTSWSHYMDSEKEG